MFITFLTDFGLQDDFVGTCHGVIARIAPDARVIDLTHGIAPQAVLQGALVLRIAYLSGLFGVTMLFFREWLTRTAGTLQAKFKESSVRPADSL